MTKEYRKIDLHLHTVASDGTDTPEELLCKLRAAGIGLFSVTDHDAIMSVERIPGMLRAGDPDFINGVEFSCKSGTGKDAEKYHILGYGFDPGNADLLALLEKAHGFRIEKAVKRLEFLESEFKFKFSEEEKNSFLSQYSPAKPHLGNMMIARGYARDMKDAVENYIDKREFENVNPTPAEAIDAIIAAGGIPVLAHGPFADGKGGKDGKPILGKELEARVAGLIALGLKGLEGYYEKYTPEMQAEVLGLAEKYGLYVTAGSDYHGENKKVILGDDHLADASRGPEGLERFLNDVRIIRAGDAE